MLWKTAASSHLAAYLMMAPLLISLFGVCSNGLLPDAMLQKAMLACHHEIPFACGEGVGLEAAMTYFLLKMRQLAAKLRSLQYVRMECFKPETDSATAREFPCNAPCFATGFLHGMF